LNCGLRETIDVVIFFDDAFSDRDQIVDGISVSGKLLLSFEFCELFFKIYWQLKELLKLYLG